MLAPEPYSLDDDALAGRSTVYAADCLANQTVVVSGGAGGIGRAVSWLFARLGAHVVILGRKTNPVDELVGKLRAAGYSASGAAFDIRNRSDVDQFWDAIWAERKIDVVINCAGGQFPKAAIDISDNGWKSVIETNLNGTWFMMQAAAKKFRDNNHPGSFVNIVIVVGRSLYGIAHSTAARAGVIGLSEALAVEWAPYGIRINCVAPGLIETEGWRVYSAEARAQYGLGNPMKKYGTSWDVAEACAYFAAPSSNFITGELLSVDGGGRHWGEVWTTGKPEYFRS